MSNKQRLIAWGSLVLGIASAVLMDRRPERAWLVMVAVGCGWLGAIFFMVLGRGDPKPETKVLRAARTASRLLAFGPVQFALFFTLPFYWRALAGTWEQFVFVGCLITAALLTLWDPWHEAVAKHPWGGALLQALATFATLNALLPIFGLANGASLWLAALTTSAITPAIAHFTTQPELRQRRALVIAALLPLLALMPPLRSVVPPAPLRLVQGGIGTGIHNHELSGQGDAVQSPTELVCLSHIWAPRGLRDALVHVWRHNHHITDEIAITVQGGREAGFRTWSAKRNLGIHPQGMWTCTLETQAGQLLGEHSVQVH